MRITVPAIVALAVLVPVTLPALVGTKSNPLAKLRIETSGVLKPILVTELRATLDGTTDLQDVASIQIGEGETGYSYSL